MTMFRNTKYPALRLGGPDRFVGGRLVAADEAQATRIRAYALVHPQSGITEVIAAPVAPVPQSRSQERRFAAQKPRKPQVRKPKPEAKQE
jgi:hypothetical protein